MKRRKGTNRLHGICRSWRALVCAAIVLLPAWARAGEGRAVRIQLKWTHQFQFAGFYAALEQGFYREAGLDVELLAGGPAIDPAHVVAEGKAEFGVGNSSLIIERSQGHPVVAVAAIFQHSPFVVLARRTPGLDGVRDLEGRTVMIEAHSAEIMVYLMAAGIRRDALRLVPHSGDVKVLRDGAVDAVTAYTTSEPFDLIREGIAYQIFNPRELGIDFYGDTLFTTSRLAEDDPELVRRVRDATLRGWRFALAHPNEMIDRLMQRWAPALDRRKLEFEAEEIRRLMIADVVGIGYMNAERWGHIAASFTAAGLIPRAPDMENFLFEADARPDLSWIYRGVALLLVVVLTVSAIAFRFLRLNRSLRREVERRSLLEAELQRLAATDSLTGLVNRRHFQELAEGEFRRARRLNARLSVAYIDIDHFKCINDTWGHFAGDRAIQAVAALCAGNLRDVDVLGRIGGEEFAALLPGAGEEVAAAVAERIRRAVSATGLETEASSIPITISIGVAEMDDADGDVSRLLARADNALYQAKRGGRDRVVAWRAFECPCG